MQILKRTATEDEVKADSQQQEPLIGLELQHPCIVKTLVYGTKAVEVTPPPSISPAQQNPGLWNKSC